MVERRCAIQFDSNDCHLSRSSVFFCLSSPETLVCCRSTRWMLPLLNGVEPCTISVQHFGQPISPLAFNMARYTVEHLRNSSQYTFWSKNVEPSVHDLKSPIDHFLRDLTQKGGSSFQTFRTEAFKVWCLPCTLHSLVWAGNWNTWSVVKVSGVLFC